MNSSMRIKPSPQGIQDALASLFRIRHKVFRQHKDWEDISQRWNKTYHHDNPGPISRSGSYIGREASLQWPYPSLPAQNPPNREASDFASDSDARHSREAT